MTARAMLRQLHASARPVFDVSARGRIYRVLADNPAGAIRRGIELYAAEFGPIVPATLWTVRKLTHTKG